MGRLISPKAPFFIAALLCIPAALALLLIRGSEIGFARARQSSGDQGVPAAPWSHLLSHRALLIFAGCLFLFQFANASLLPLASERLAGVYKTNSELFTSALVVVPQVAAALIALGGLTAAVIGVLTPLIVADCTKNTGLFNSALGTTGMIAGIGATISTTVTGLVAQLFGFTWAFIAISAVATTGAAAVYFFLPETVHACHEDAS